jgi:hypothetical protein
MTSLLRLAAPGAVSALALAAAPALADVALPAPYLSRALDAVLLPIDSDVRAVFDLAAVDAGVLVLATEPGGVADANGVIPGDVLYLIGGQKIASPIEVDEIVYYWLLEGIFDFDLGLYRDGGVVELVSTITEESYWEVIEVTTVETWSSWEVSSFSYEEYAAEYSEEIIESYETSETVIEETVSSEEYVAEMSEESYDESEEMAAEESTDETSADLAEEESYEEPEDGVASDDEAFADEADDAMDQDAAEEDYSEDESGDDGSDGSDEPTEDEGYDEPVEESYDEGGDGGDEG